MYVLHKTLRRRRSGRGTRLSASNLTVLTKNWLGLIQNAEPCTYVSTAGTRLLRTFAMYFPESTRPVMQQTIKDGIISAKEAVSKWNVSDLVHGSIRCTMCKWLRTRRQSSNLTVFSQQFSSGDIERHNFAPGDHVTTSHTNKSYPLVCLYCLLLLVFEMSLRAIFGTLVLSTASFFVSLHFHWPPYAGIAVRKSYKGLASLVKISNTSTWTSGLNNTTHVAITKANVNTKTLQAYKDACQSTYKKPGPDSLCQGRPTLRTQWLERIAHNWSLPTASGLAGSPRPKFPSTPKRFLEVEFKCMSQATEDGILLAIFNALGTQNRRGIEIGRLGWCNLMNLAVNFDFDVLFFEGGARDYTCPANFLHTPSDGAARRNCMVAARLCNSRDLQ